MPRGGSASTSLLLWSGWLVYATRCYALEGTQISRTRDIKQVFHELGLVLAGICGALGVAAMGIGAHSYYAGHGHDTVVATSAGIGMLILAVAGYAAARALGWVIARIVGDGDQNSN